MGRNWPWHHFGFGIFRLGYSLYFQTKESWIWGKTDFGLALILIDLDIWTLDSDKNDLLLDPHSDSLCDAALPFSFLQENMLLDIFDIC